LAEEPMLNSIILILAGFGVLFLGIISMCIAMWISNSE